MAKHEEQKIKEIYEHFVGLPDSGFAEGIKGSSDCIGAFYCLNRLGTFFFSRRRQANFLRQQREKFLLVVSAASGANRRRGKIFRY